MTTPGPDTEALLERARAGDGDARQTLLTRHGDRLRRYTLIYTRFVASQMAPALFAVTNVEVVALARETQAVGVLKAQGRILKFDGFRRVLPPGGKQEDGAKSQG